MRTVLNYLSQSCVATTSTSFKCSSCISQPCKSSLTSSSPVSFACSSSGCFIWFRPIESSEGSSVSACEPLVCRIKFIKEKSTHGLRHCEVKKSDHCTAQNLCGSFGLEVNNFHWLWINYCLFYLIMHDAFT